MFRSARLGPEYPFAGIVALIVRWDWLTRSFGLQKATDRVTDLLTNSAIGVGPESEGGRSSLRQLLDEVASMISVSVQPASLWMGIVMNPEPDAGQNA